MAEKETAIEFRNVKFGYVPGQSIFTNINFRVAQGDAVCLVGPNGGEIGRASCRERVSPRV